MRSLKLASVLLIASLGGCATTAEVRAGGYPGAPALVEISPGVMAVADWTTPVFFADDVYWSFLGGFWYRSAYFDHGFVRAGRVPPIVGRIDRPERYVRYHGDHRAIARGPAREGGGHPADRGQGHQGGARSHRR